MVIFIYTSLIACQHQSTSTVAEHKNASTAIIQTLSKRKQNMQFTTPVSELIRRRFSCRTYQLKAISGDDLSSLQDILKSSQFGPLGNQIRFKIAAADKNDYQQLKGLGTYGFIKNPAGFVIGAIQDSPGAFEDFGYQTELIVLGAAELGVSSCWLGGTFRKSRFSKVMELQPGEDIPSIISIGYPADQQAWIDRATRVIAGADRRLGWESLFFDCSFETPLTREAAGKFAEPLDMVRLAPSASNKQPWRIIKQGDQCHFFIQRTRKYPPTAFKLLINAADLQRIDLGIAMAHFEQTANELSLTGNWVVQDPGLHLPDTQTEYTISWIPG